MRTKDEAQEGGRTSEHFILWVATPPDGGTTRSRNHLKHPSGSFCLWRAWALPESVHRGPVIRLSSPRSSLLHVTQPQLARDLPPSRFLLWLMRHSTPQLPTLPHTFGNPACRTLQLSKLASSAQSPNVRL